jgi:hypothetical protein
VACATAGQEFPFRSVRPEGDPGGDPGDVEEEMGRNLGGKTPCEKPV